MRYPLLAGLLVAASSASAQLMVPDSGTGDRIMLFSRVDGSIIDLDWITDAGAVGWAFSTPKEACVVGEEIWVSDQLTDSVIRFDMNRQFLGQITMHPDGGLLDNVRGLGTDGTKVYLTVWPSPVARKGVAVYDLAGNPTDFWNIQASLFDAEPFQGDVLVSNSDTDAVERYSQAGQFLGNFATGIIFTEQTMVIDDGSVITVSSITAPPVEGVYHFNADGTLRLFIDTQGLKNQFGEHVPRGAFLLDNGDYFIASSTGLYTYNVATATFHDVIKGPNAQHIGVLPKQPPACYPDCNGDAVLNLSDFGCFTTKFALGDPYADCNGDAVLNLSDFGCFTTKFALGCP